MLQLEDAVGLLVEHLVDPVLPLGQVVDREDALSPETQEAVARQVRNKLACVAPPILPVR